MTLSPSPIVRLQLCQRRRIRSIQFQATQLLAAWASESACDLRDAFKISGESLQMRIRTVCAWRKNSTNERRLFLFRREGKWKTTAYFSENHQEVEWEKRKGLKRQRAPLSAQDVVYVVDRPFNPPKLSLGAHFGFVAAVVSIQPRAAQQLHYLWVLRLLLWLPYWVCWYLIMEQK